MQLSAKNEADRSDQRARSNRSPHGASGWGRNVSEGRTLNARTLQPPDDKRARIWTNLQFAPEWSNNSR
jgi:hypothetical protein